MKKLKVYLQYPWKFPDSPYYKYLINSPPEKVEYLNTKREKGAVTNKNFLKFITFAKVNLRKYSNRFKLNIPNAHLTPKGNYELIHCAHCLSKNNDKPWIADVESTWSIFIGGDNRKSGQNKVRKILMNNNCKKILPWTKATEKEYLEMFPEVKDKIELVYPAIPEIKNLKKPKNKKLKIIFVARFFYLKGGLIALETLERLRKKFGIEGIVVSNVPEHLKKKYPKLKIYDLLPHKEVCNLLEKSDLFFYPCPNDTFGFSLLEAMAYGLPTITIFNRKNTISRKEIIENGKTGTIFDVEKVNTMILGENEEKIILKLVEESEKLIKNKSLREKMKNNCLNEIKLGKFSIKQRNLKLRKIYEDSLK